LPENIDKTLALRNAIKSGETELAKNLIFSLDKADLDEQDKDGKTPLHLATSYGDIVIVNALIDRKVNLELKDRIGRTPLHYAAQSDRLEVAEILITKGAYIDSTDEYNITPLSIALYHASPEFFKFLKDNRAKVDVKGKDGLTILTLAKIRVKNLLLDAYAENEKELKDADTKLAILTGVDPASYSGVGFKSNISDNSTDEKKLLEEAIDKNDVKLAINLIKSLSRKDLESKIDSDGNTFIHLASFKGHTKIIESLLDKGIDVNIRNNNNDTPLHFGSYSGRIENINFLLEREANLNLENNQCNTALHLAVHFLTTSEKIQDQAKYNAIIKLLTAQKVNLKDGEDKAISTGEKTRKRKCVRKAPDNLNQHHANNLRFFALECNFLKVKELLEKGANPNWVAKEGDHPPITLVVLSPKKDDYEKIEIIALLYKYGADLDTKNFDNFFNNKLITKSLRDFLEKLSAKDPKEFSVEEFLESLPKPGGGLGSNPRKRPSSDVQPINNEPLVTKMSRSEGLG
jgi:ankyrin repeat protein